MTWRLAATTVAIAYTVEAVFGSPSWINAVVATVLAVLLWIAEAARALLTQERG